MRPIILFHADGFNHHIFFWNILVETFVPSGNPFDFIHNVHTFHHFTKHCIAPFLHNSFAKHLF